MARVPTYDQQRVQPRPAPFTPVSAPRFGSGMRDPQFTQGPVPGNLNPAAAQDKEMGRSMQRLGEEFNRQAVSMQIDANKAIVTDAVNASMQKEFELEYGDNGYLTQTYRNALDRADNKSLWDEYAGKLGKANDEISRKMLRNDAQRRAFNERTSKQHVVFTGRIMQHVAKEQKKYNISVQAGKMAIASQHLASAQTEVQREEARQQVTEAATEFARLSDLSPESAQAGIVKALSGPNAVIITRMVNNGHSDIAKTYFQNHAGEMTPGIMKQMSDLIHSGERKDSINNAVTTITSSGKSPDDMLKDAGKVNSDIKEDVQRLVAANISRQRIVHNQQLEQNAAKAADIAASGESILPSLLNGLSPGVRNALELYSTRIKSGVPIVTDPAKWTEYYMMSDADRAKMTTSEYMTKYLNAFNTSAYNRGLQLFKESKALVAGNTKDPNGQTVDLSNTTRAQSISMYVKSIYGSNKLTNDTTKKIGFFTIKANQRFDDFIEAHHRKPNDTEKRKILDILYKDMVYVDQTGRDPLVRFASLSPEAQADTYVHVNGKDIAWSDIPPAAVEEIILVHRYKSNGYYPTQQQIAEAWVQKQANEKEKRQAAIANSRNENADKRCKN